MGLSNNLVSQFVKVTNDKKEDNKETIVYGKVHKIDGSKPTEVIIDGATESTPVSSTVNAKEGDIVIVTIKNHHAVITGNLGSQSLIGNDVAPIAKDATEAIQAANNASSKIAEFQTVLSEKVSTTELYAELGKIENLETDSLLAQTVKANKADIDTLKAASGDFEKISAIEADITTLKTNKLDAETAKTTYANIDFSNIGEAALKKILADSGLIKDIIIGDGTITGKLVGVTITGDLIEGNTVVADKLVVKGSDGLYYKLNTDGIKTEAEQTDYNSLNGSVIKAKSITATKISVDDLVAFDATIGGFNITENSLYSGVKSSVDNTTQGIYLDKEGQMAIGDSNNFIKYYKDQNGVYKLEISSVDNIKVGGRNLLRNSSALKGYGAAPGITYSNTEDGYLQVVAESGNSNWFSLVIGHTYEFVEEELAEGDDFTISFTMRSPDSTYIPSIYIKSGLGYYDMKGALSSEWSTVWYSGKWKDANSIGFHLGFLNRVGTYEIKNCKIEKGNKPTDWTPALEDMATNSQITAVETKIIQNSDAIKLRATKTEVTQAVENIEIGGRNLVPTSVFREARGVESTKEFELKNCWATPYIENTNLITILEPATQYTVRYELELIERTSVPTMFDMMVGFLIYSNAHATWISLATNMSDTAEIGTKQTVQKTFTTPDEWNDELLIAYSRRWTTEGSEPIGFDAFKVTNFKIEKGNKATDWTPAPEDMATAIDVEGVVSTAEDAQSRVAKTEALIEVLSESISMLVTDSSGASLMTQTENGWTFSTTEIQALVDSTSEGLNDLINTVDNTNHAIDILQQAVDDLGEIAEYVKITTYENEPCIELGEGDSDFKLRITNTRMMFMEGSTVLAYFNNQSFHVKKAVVEEELQQGGFVWKARSNGNLGLVWKGGIS